LDLKKNTTSSLSTHLKNPRIMIYIKPWDQTVFENFFVFLRTVQDLLEEFQLFIDLTVSKELNDEY